MIGFSIYLIALAAVLLGIAIAYAFCALSVYAVDKLCEWYSRRKGL